MGIFPETKTGKFKDDFTLHKALGTFDQLTKWKPSKPCKGSVTIQRPNGSLVELLFWYGPQGFGTQAYEFRDKEHIESEHAKWRAQHRAIRKRVMASVAKSRQRRGVKSTRQQGGVC